MAKARGRDPAPTPATSTRPNSTSAAFSIGPKASAVCASRGPSKATPIVAATPAMKLPNALMPSAAPARPRRAIS